MTDDFLKVKIDRVARRYHWLAFWRKLAACWATAALLGIGVAWLLRQAGWWSPFVMPTIAAVAGTIATALLVRHFERRPDPRWVARKIEAKFPELNGVLLTAVQNGLTRDREPGYLQDRLLREATARSQQQDWRQVVPWQRLFAGHVVHLVALACFVLALDTLRAPSDAARSRRPTAPTWANADGVNVTPGDATLERGESLVVLAQFGKSLPATVNMVVRENGVAERTVPLVKSLADPVFGGSVADVAGDFTYRIEYSGGRTRDFKVSVYEHPRLTRADVSLTFPDYTKLPPKSIQDTRRVSAVEGTKLDYVLQLNKPVQTAKLIARGEPKMEIPLQLEAGKPTATLPGWVPAKSGTFDLQLIDADGRANKVATPFVIDVQPNRPPEVRLASPRGDVRPSALEEVTFDGTIWDDFGVPAYGLAYTVAGGETKFIELGREVPAKDKRSFNHLLNLESLGAKPDDLIAWHAWADDIGPDGKVRRTSGDLYFAEVRPFDEVFRESQNMQSDQQGGAQGNERRRLTDLQKQIINATWRLQRDGATPKYIEDARIVRESQLQVLDQARQAQAETPSPRDQAMWREATQHMVTALDRLKDAATTPGPLAQALPAEQAAYQALLKLQARETNVTRQQNPGGGGGGDQANQRQIDQLDLKQSENRYETQRQARAPENQQRREQLAIMNRLQELARRQQDLNERLKELQTALQEAKTEEEREELRRRLKRLEEEQRQMLADADEIRQRMERAENQAAMSEQRQQLDQTREELQRAADAAGQGSVSQALASGTRAERQLEQMRDELREQNSSQFAEDLREMRTEARELARAQDELTQKLDALGERGAQRRTLSESGERKELLDELAQQKERMSNLLQRAQQVSEQAENSEPLLSRQLYDSLRKVSQDDANSIKDARQELLSSGLLTRDLANRLQQASEREGGAKVLDVASEMLREGYLPQASQAGQRARAEIEELRQGVERAAESVLGDDAEQLRLARSELDRLTEQLQREMQQAQNQGRGGQARSNEKSGEPGAAGEPREPGEGQRGIARDESQPGQNSENGQQPGEQPGENRQASAGQEKGRSKSGESRDGQSPEGETGDGQAGGNRANQGSRENRVARDSNSPGQGGGEQNRDGTRPEGERRRALSINDLLRGNNAGDGGGDLQNIGWDGEWLGNGPLMGANFGEWADRLRDVEDLLESPELRNAVAAARERARLMRRDYSHDLKKPDWAVVQLQIVKPLVEVRTRVAEELARRGSRDSLAPIDRDPVPNKYLESVRRYYEELGRGEQQREAAP